MKRNLPVVAALAMILISSAFVPSMKASEFDKRTVITISQPVSVQGTILPAGQYVLKLQGDVIYIFNGEETRLITAVLAIHADRLQPADKSEFSFYDSHAGEAPVLHRWFYPGDNTGFEFLQPRHTAAAKSSAVGG